MMYLPCATEFYFEQIAPRFYRVVSDNLMVNAPHCMVDEAIEVLAGDQFDDSEDAL